MRTPLAAEAHNRPRSVKRGLARAAVGLLLAQYAVGCGGDDDAGSRAAPETTGVQSQSMATVPDAAKPLVGTWEGRGFLVRFGPEGKFSIDTDGSLEDGSYVWGTYTAERSKVRFIANEASPCRGEEWDWEISFREDRLDAELLNDACTETAGQRWSFGKR